VIAHQSYKTVFFQF